MQRGKESRNKFLDEILTDPARFEQPIKREKLINFASENFQKRNKSALAKKVAEAKGTRDLWGRIVFLATQGKMNIEHCLSFPITPNSPSLSNHHGSLRKTDKPKLMHSLEDMVERCFPPKSDVVIVDVFFSPAQLGTITPSTSM